MRLSIRIVNSTMVVLVCLLAAASWQDGAMAQSRWIRIDTNRPESNVYADSTWLGLANMDIYRLPEGARQISLIPAIADVWSIPSVTFDLTTLLADTTDLELDFPYYYSLESIPSGANVYIGRISSGDAIGTTPMLYESEFPVENAFVFELDGYRLEHIFPLSNLWNRNLVSLQSEKDLYLGLPEASADAPKARRRWIDYLAVSAVVAGGVLAVHYKTQANNLYDKYTQTGDPDVLVRVEALDTRSAIALGTMQIGFTVVVFRIAF